MIDLITGVPGSGKTYYAVDALYKLITAKDKKYKHIITNIGGLDYKKCNELANDSDYVQSFEFIDLKNDMDSEYAYHLQSKNIVSTLNLKYEDKFELLNDDDYKQLNELQQKIYDKKKVDFDREEIEKQLKQDYDKYVKSKGVFQKYQDSLVIIDECHLYFESREDDVLIRFLSYHRHFNIDIYLITQNKNLINKKYLSFIETMYMAYPASKRLFSKAFRYKKYASYQEYHANIMGNISLKLSKNVFDLYSSGSNVLGKSVISKMLLPIIALILIVGIGFKLLLSFFSVDTPAPVSIPNDSNISKVATVKSKVSPIVQDEIQSNKPLFLVDCYSDSCIFKGSNTSFQSATLFKLINEFKCKVIINDEIDSNYKTYVMRCESGLQDVLKLFKKNSEFQNEKNINSSSGTSKPFNF